MRTTIDRDGRIVIPKALREELGMSAGQELELRAADGVLEITIPGTSVPELTPDAVRETLERTRR
jgi:AbrB family looped-hinge helix DNA binding protein